MFCSLVKLFSEMGAVQTYSDGTVIAPSRSIDFDDEVPKGFDLILLPEADYLVFQGEPFDEKDYCQAIEEVQESIKKYDPTIWGYKWDKNNPRIQLEPIGTRGYIEMVAVKKS